ncbi:MAG: glycosyltransferase family 2 protein [Chitinophagaceae bacterium]|nr:glycosyltransferase family 2 protein [Chitinophagaceae bacterium]MCW5926256.1 glycosyltransferase family 2 protein [Chitinophagaceae bacterium]
MKKGLSIIIVNYKTPQLIIGCLESIFRNNDNLNDFFEVIVVDNFSEDDSENLIKQRFPFIQWLQMGYNSGFARANNSGIRHSNGEVVLLLNSDTLNVDNAIEKCLNDFRQSSYSACGVQLLNEDLTPQISGNYNITGGLNNLLPIPYFGKIVQWLGVSLKVKKTNIPEATCTVKVDWINGAFLMVKKTAIEKAGLLDEDFFLYSEEAEWCSRIKRTGPLCIFGQYKIIHLQGYTANRTFGSANSGYHSLHDRKGRQIMLSSFVRIKKEFGTGWFVFQLLLYSASSILLFPLSFIDNLIRAKNPLSDYRILIGFLTNVLTIWTFTPRIIINRPYFYKVL